MACKYSWYQPFIASSTTLDGVAVAVNSETLCKVSISPIQSSFASAGTFLRISGSESAEIKVIDFSDEIFSARDNSLVAVFSPTLGKRHANR